ncbi:phosphate-starvation-inducible PsiE family protein [Kitasatospora sp. NPDC052896]|uniref:phosphate-starvation-inducible PsiE family protein n=1 Tax=Kitasatospora sp. NPDC052896 TaxID=3364061 RepID=UPI0037C802FB
MRVDPRRFESRLQGFLETAEDGVYLIVATLLILLAVLLTVGVFTDLVHELRSVGSYDAATLSALDSSLVLFIVAELLHTVRLTIRNRTLDAEPFLIVGLIASIRKVLIVTASPDKTFNWNVQGIEFLVLAGLLSVLVLALYCWRRATRPESFRTLE